MSDCTCNGNFGSAPCPVHLPDYTHRAMEAGVTKARANIGRLAQDREAIATAAINTLGELLLSHVSPAHRAYFQQLWSQLASVAIERATLRAESVQVVDERGPGSVVDLVDER